MPPTSSLPTWTPISHLFQTTITTCLCGRAAGNHLEAFHVAVDLNCHPEVQTPPRRRIPASPRDFDLDSLPVDHLIRQTTVKACPGCHPKTTTTPPLSELEWIRLTSQRATALRQQVEVARKAEVEKRLGTPLSQLEDLLKS